MSSRTVRGAAVVAASLLATAAVSQPAQAETRTFQDGGAHLTSVRVDHTSSTVKVKAHVGPMRIGSDVTFWLDTDPGDAGPEYKIQVYPNSEGPSLMRVGSFTSAGQVVRCDALYASADVYGPPDVSIGVPRSCLRRPAKVRVSVRGYFAEPGPDVVDWAPGFRQFFGWVHSS